MTNTKIQQVIMRTPQKQAVYQAVIVEDAIQVTDFIVAGQWTTDYDRAVQEAKQYAEQADHFYPMLLMASESPERIAELTAEDKMARHLDTTPLEEQVGYDIISI